MSLSQDNDIVFYEEGNEVPQNLVEQKPKRGRKSGTSLSVIDDNKLAFLKSVKAHNAHISRHGNVTKTWEGVYKDMEALGTVKIRSLKDHLQKYVEDFRKRDPVLTGNPEENPTMATDSILAEICEVCFTYVFYINGFIKIYTGFKGTGW